MPLKQTSGYDSIDKHVVYHHYTPSSKRCTVDLRGVPGVPRAQGIWYLHNEGRSRTRAAVYGYRAVLEVDHAFAYGHAKAASRGSAAGFAHFLRVRLKQVLHEVLAYANAGIRDLEMQKCGFFRYELLRRKKHYPASGRREFIRVGQQIIQDLPQGYLVSLHVFACYPLGIQSELYTL